MALLGGVCAFLPIDRERALLAPEPTPWDLRRFDWLEELDFDGAALAWEPLRALRAAAREPELWLVVFCP